MLVDEKLFWLAFLPSIPILPNFYPETFSVNFFDMFSKKNRWSQTVKYRATRNIFYKFLTSLLFYLFVFFYIDCLQYAVHYVLRTAFITITSYGIYQQLSLTQLIVKSLCGNVGFILNCFLIVVYDDCFIWIYFFPQVISNYSNKTVNLL